jgi:hypothetical protein
VDVAQHRRVIRNVCIHVANEQPLMADLYALPSASDAGLVCTNVRGLDGKRPVFIDHVGSTFFFPYHVVRFLEIPAGAVQGLDLEAGAGPGTAAGGGGDRKVALPRGADLADRSDETPVDPSERLPVVIGAPDAQVDDDPEAELEIDEGFLQRIRDI